MRGSFSLFQSHLDLAHDYWKCLLKRGDCVIDATCGNGYDTATLAKLCLGEDSGQLYAIDLQQEAIATTSRRLAEELDEVLFRRIVFLQQCHSYFPESIPPESVKLVVYNLGYLPGGDKQETTESSTTLESVRKALGLLGHGGAISITCYPGHHQGAVEEAELLSFCQTLDPKEWSCCHHRWINRKLSPSLLMIQKAIAKKAD